MIYILQVFADLEWKQILFGTEKWSFLIETVIRTMVMFLVILLGLRLLGKRGVKQLSVFELGVIIGLGSAAGDPMFYSEVGLLPGILVFVVVLLLYRLITYFINTSDSFEKFVEGKPTTIIEKGCLVVKNFKKEPIALDEMFAQFRLRNISHLGQVQLAILETNGEVSVFYMENDEVLYGLPIIPDHYKYKTENIIQQGIYACTYCGRPEELLEPGNHTCKSCGKKQWLKAINWRRIA
jgi:uncharacterized membrane protein YcaP (DUF421 family)